MNNAITASLYNRLASDNVLTNLLATFMGANPAIFTGDRIPSGAERPYIIISGNITAMPFESKSSWGREVTRDIRCYADGVESTVEIEMIAERVRTLLHHHSLVISGCDNAMSCIATPPENAPPEDGIIGRIISVNIIVMES